EPGRVKKLNESERQKNKQRHHSRNQHNDRKGPSDITGKGYIPEAECCHHREGPIKTGDPAVSLSLINHDKMEERGINQNQQRKSAQKPEQSFDIYSGISIG